MLAVHMCMDILGVDVEALGQGRLQAAGIQNGTGANDLPLGDTGDLVEHIGHDIHGIAHHHKHRFRRILRKLGCNLLENIHIHLGQIQPGHTGLSGNTAGDHHNIRADNIFIFAGTDDSRRDKGCRLVDIQRLANSLLLVHIHQ